MLHCNEVRANKRDVVDLPERPDDTRVINTRDENGKQVCKECGLFLKVERQ